MLLRFYKMNGAGNDFIVIDNRDLSIKLDGRTIEALCDRHRGIGADGLLAVEPAEAGADFRFRYYNADGGEAEMCGNGARCFGRFTAHLGDGVAERVSFETIAGILTAEMAGDGVRIAMSDPVALEMETGAGVAGLGEPVHFVNTGVPHAVVFVADEATFDELDVHGLGRALRNHPRFAPAGTNVNFARVVGKSHIAIRTYERGVEAETLACGTGMVACAILHHKLTGDPSPIEVDVAGGDTLEIGFVVNEDGGFREVTLTGPADFVFEGEIEI
ncbi:MAG: diaminopimelate epimerase [Luteolibacter sp.]|jgi:diaminopimelate epimerase